MRLVSIQALRGIAVLLVVSLHVYSFEMLAGVGTPLMPALPVLGSSGVDLFFVISGFVMMHTTRGVTGTVPEIRAFLSRRLWRIYPLYWLFTFALLAGYLALPGLTRRTGLTTDIVIDSVLLIPQSAPAVLPVAWTLTHELYFYFVFSLLLFLPRSLRVAGLGCWLAALILATLVNPSKTGPWWTLITHPLTFEFILGCAVWLLLSKRSFRSGPIPFLLGTGLLLAVSLGQPALEDGRELAGWSRAIGLGIPYALILYSLVGMEADRLWSPRSILASIGDASYSIYLCHFPVLSLVSKLFAGAAGFADTHVWDNLLYIACAYGTAVGVGIASYRLIETRILRAGKRITLNIGNAYVPSPASR